MCGICGALSLDKPLNAKYAYNMTQAIRHRGPDDAGFTFFHTGTRQTKATSKASFYLDLTSDEFKHKNPLLPSIQTARAELFAHNWDVFLAHRRLSIIDTSSASHQPMSDLSKKIWLGFNGTIYNFKVLKNILEREGFAFKSSGDTEVIIYAYIRWGLDCFKMFNGHFAIVIYDDEQKKLVLARDRYGTKPLYYCSQDGVFVFASEAKAILEYKDLRFSADKEAIYEYFTFQNIFTNKTFFKSIHTLEAGHVMTVDLQEKAVLKEQFWDYNFAQEPMQEKKASQDLKELFAKAVSNQLVSDVSLGSYLSGGIDSGSITAVASKEIQDLTTFTIGFDLSSASGLELGFDERRLSELMSYAFKTEHYEMVLKAGDMERCLADFTYAIETPKVGQSYPNFYAAKLASKFVKVVLNGAGGDELFAGYPWRYYPLLESKNFDDFVDKYYLFWQRLVPNKDLKELFSPIQNDVKNVWTRDIFANVFQKKPLKTTADYLNASLYFEAKTFLHGLLLVEDALSMHHGLETRAPFLDNDLVDFAQKVPLKFKLKAPTKQNENELKKRTNNGKIILRQAMSEYLPKEIQSRKKQGFSSPDESWFRGDSIEYLQNILRSNSKMYEFLDKKKTKEIIDLHLSGKQNKRLFVWSVINFNKWCEIWL